MKSFMEYKGYQGSVSYSDEDQVFFGRVMHIPALVSYEGTDVKSLRESFQEAVDDYLELCQEQGIKPELPFQGSLNVQIPSELHRRAALYASDHNANLNTVVADALEKYLETADR